jgi:hypothetical protein
VRKHSRTTRNSTKKFRRVSLASVVVASVVIAIAAVTVVSRQSAGVQEPTEQERSAAVAKKKKVVTVEVAGQQVQVDSQTGQIEQLSPEEREKLAAGLRQLVNKSTKDLKEVQHADGSVSVDLEDHFQSVTVAKQDKDGNVVQSCVDNPRAAGAFFGIDSKQIDNKKEAPSRPSQVTPATNRN